MRGTVFEEDINVDKLQNAGVGSEKGGEGSCVISVGRRKTALSRVSVCNPEEESQGLGTLGRVVDARDEDVLNHARHRTLDGKGEREKYKARTIKSAFALSLTGAGFPYLSGAPKNDKPGMPSEPTLCM